MKKIIACLITIVCVLSYSCSNPEKSFNKAVVSRQIEDFNRIIEKYPKSEYVDSAKAKVNEIEYWMRIDSSLQIANYQIYLNSYPNALFNQEANLLLTEIYAYDSVRVKDVTSEYIAFQNRFPNSLYNNSINKRIKVLKQGIEVKPSELSFEFRNYNYEGSIVAGGGVKPIGGNIGQFLCEGVSLALKSSKFENGFVITQDYGKIKVIFGTSLYGESFSIYLKEDQKEALISLKKSGNNTVSAETEYHPVHYTELLFAFKGHDYSKGTVVDGAFIPDGGNIGEFHCSIGSKDGQSESSKKIKLLSTKFEKGFINTELFGKIKVNFNESGQYVIFLTDSQKNEIKKYVSQ